MMRFFLTFFVCIIILSGCALLDDGTNNQINPQRLNFNTWTSGSLDDSYYAEDWFVFSAEEGVEYLITWDDSYDGSGNFTCNINLSICPDTSHVYTDYQDMGSGYTSPIIFNSPKDGNLYLQIEDYWSSGSYAVMVCPLSTGFYELAGTVSLQDGNPAAYTTVSFPLGEEMHSAVTDINGRYSIRVEDSIPEVNSFGFGGTNGSLVFSKV